ncbi:MAG: hypothetical protein NVS2B16_00860 [Chloroflexota bacterium]
MLWEGLVGIVFLISGLSSRVRTAATGMPPRRFGPAMPYTLCMSLLTFLISLPLTYFSGHIVEQRYELSNQSPGSWLREELKGIVVSLVLALPLVQGVYWILRSFPRWWWAILSALTVPFTVLLVNLAPVLILPLFNKFVPLRDRALAERIKSLAAGQGVSVSEVLEMDMSKQTKKANAFFTGIGNTKRIVLGDTLIKEFTADEVEIVLAHELSHQVRRDLWKLIGLGAATTTVTAYAVHRLADPLIKRYGSRLGLEIEHGMADVAALPLLGLLAGGASIALLPVQNAITRRYIEHPADRFALDLTGKREAFISAMEKLGRLNLSNPNPSPVIKWLMYDHPTLQERIDFGRQYASTRGDA